VGEAWLLRRWVRHGCCVAQLQLRHVPLGLARLYWCCKTLLVLRLYWCCTWQQSCTLLQQSCMLLQQWCMLLQVAQRGARCNTWCNWLFLQVSERGAITPQLSSHIQNQRVCVSLSLSLTDCAPALISHLTPTSIHPSMNVCIDVCMDGWMCDRHKRNPNTADKGADNKHDTTRPGISHDGDASIRQHCALQGVCVCVCVCVAIWRCFNRPALCAPRSNP
jgi:hypothetical protein